MRIKLEKMGKSLAAGPLIDYGLLESPWPVGETRVLDDHLGAKLLAKYPGMFSIQKEVDDVIQTATRRSRKKLYADKIKKPEDFK